MAVINKRLSLDEFLALPEEEPALEFEPDGTVVQKVSPKGRHSTLQVALCALINAFARPRRLALALPELRTVYGGAAYVPDVAVYRWERIPRTAEGEIADDFLSAPDLAIEIVSPTQSPNALVRKCVWYTANGVQVALLVDPDDASIIVFRGQAAPRVVRGDEAIDLNDIVPGLHLGATELFQQLRLQ